MTKKLAIESWGVKVVKRLAHSYIFGVNLSSNDRINTETNIIVALDCYR